MDKDRAEYTDYLGEQDFSEQEIKNLHEGKLDYREAGTEE